MMDRLFVVETDDNIYLGRIEVKDGYVIVRSGYQGHPHYVPEDEVEKMTEARAHPDVEYTTPGKPTQL